MAVYSARPPAPVFRPGHPLAAGTRLLLPMHDAAGSRVRDVSGSTFHGNFVGLPVWQTGALGPMLGGFGTTNYVVLDPPIQILGPVYPFWLAVLTISSSTVAGVLICQVSSTNAFMYFALQHNFGSTVGTVAYQVADGSTSNYTAPSLPCNDGRPHLTMGVSYAANDHRLYFDGNQVAAGTTSISQVSRDTMTIGVLRRPSNATPIQSPFAGSIGWVAAGNGAVPNPQALAADVFASIRPQRQPAALLAYVAAEGGGPDLIYAGDDAPAPGYWEA